MAAPSAGKGTSVVGMILVIALIIAVVQQVWVSCGGDPCRVDAWECRHPPKQQK